MIMRKVKRGVQPIHTVRKQPAADPAPGSTSSLRTVKGMSESKGMRSVRRFGRDQWEAAAENRRMMLARARRLRRHNPQLGDTVIEES